MRNQRSSTVPRRRGQWALTLLLALSLMVALAVSAAAAASLQGEEVDPVIPEPAVTIRGNLVVENGKPTGFYELALCVRSGYCYITPNPAHDADATQPVYLEKTPEEYAALSSAEQAAYTIQYYPFSTATAAIHVNTDVLTAVSWDLTKVTYETLTDGAYTVNTAYPKGIDTDPAVQGYTMDEQDAFPDITTANLYSYDDSGDAVAIDVEGDPRMFAATGRVEHYTEGDALVTLTAQAPLNAPVILTEDTPVVVARFAYDLKRFPNWQVNGSDWASDVKNSATGSVGGAGFWMGLDAASASIVGDTAAKVPLTWLGASSGGYGTDYAASDTLAADSTVGQSVWVHMNTQDPVYSTLQDTYFYYYLGAEDDLSEVDTVTLTVDVNGTATKIQGITLPKTEGERVLTAAGYLPANAAAAPYTFFENLLRLKDGTLALTLVNEPSFKQSSGTGGNQILFYDWDDALIGALVVGDGDVRAEVNAYLEQNLVHPDLRAGTILAGDLGGTVPDYSSTPASGSAEEEYQNLLDSDLREWTYRGKYSSTVDGTGVSYPEDEADPDYNPLLSGKEYPLTNKLDYVFYRHLNTETCLEYQDAAGTVTTERYITTAPVSSDQDAAQYPWVYGWAVVADDSAVNQANWQVRRDAAQVENVWTTFGAGELTGLDPYAGTGQAVPAALPAGTTAASGGTGITVNYPAYVDAATAAAPTEYAYELSAADGSGYLRFADFSDMKSQLSKTGQNVLIVKAVYEPGAELTSDPYQIIKEPYYNKLNGEAASQGGAYSAELTVERANTLQSDGLLRGSQRVRDPAVRQDTTVDAKWIEDAALGVSNDLSNPDTQTAIDRTQTTYAKVDTDNGDEISFTLALSARQNKVNYFLTEMYGYSFVTGTQRTITNFNNTGSAHVIDNYYYLTDDQSTADAYFDQPGVYYPAPRYAVREGTHGFVLYGTLNYIMEQATLLNRGEITRATFNGNVGYQELRDCNLYLDNGLTQPDILNFTEFGDKIIALADLCEANQSADTWNSELDCAEVSYHQLQHYLTSGDFYASRAAADAAAIDWCHLHKSCFQDPEAEAAPKTWAEIIAYAADPEKADGIALLTGGASGKIEELTSLRVNAYGDCFPSGGTFQTRITDAVAKLTNAGQPLSWVNLQYYLIEGIVPTGSAAAEKAATDYWWYAGATSKPAGAKTLAALVEAVKVYSYGAELKDGATVAGWVFGLDGVADIFEANAAADPDKSTTAWNRLTENLVAGWTVNDDGTETCAKFADYAAFQQDGFAAILALDAEGVSTDDPLYWYKLQYYVLNGSVPTDEEPEFARYWWHNGGKFYVVKDLQTMLEVAALAGADEPEAGAAAAWENFAYAAVEANSELVFSQDFMGNLYTADDMDAFKAEILAMCRLPGAPALSESAAASESARSRIWRDVQYYLIHDEMADVEPLDSVSAAAESDAGYYWWKDGGAPAALPLSTWDQAFPAAFAYTENGNTKAWDNLESNATLMQESKLRNYDAVALVTSNAAVSDPIYDYADLALFTTEDLKAAAVAYVTDTIASGAAEGHGHTAPTPSWFALQHYLVHGTWDSDLYTEEELQARYWWYDGAAEDPNKPEEALDQPLKDWIATYLVSDETIDTLTKEILADGKLDFRITTAGTAPTDTTMTKAVIPRLKTLLANAGSVPSLTWYQVQTALWPSTNVTGVGTVGNGALVDAATAKAAYEAKVSTAKDWRPDWVKSADGALTGYSARGQEALLVELPEADGETTTTTTVTTQVSVGEDGTTVTTTTTTVTTTVTTTTTTETPTETPTATTTATTTTPEPETTEPETTPEQEPEPEQAVLTPAEPDITEPEEPDLTEVDITEVESVSFSGAAPKLIGGLFFAGQRIAPQTPQESPREGDFEFPLSGLSP